MALRQWYDSIRGLFIGPDFSQILLDGLKQTLQLAIDERIRQLKRLKGKIEPMLSGRAPDKTDTRFCAQWDRIAADLVDLQRYPGLPDLKDPFVKMVEQAIQINGKAYTRCITSLAADQSAIGTQWLQSIVDHVINQVGFTINPKP
jgi:hypothetical protein